MNYKGGSTSAEWNDRINVNEEIFHKSMLKLTPPVIQFSFILQCLVKVQTNKNFQNTFTEKIKTKIHKKAPF